MPTIHRETNDLDRLPPALAAAGRVPPWYRPEPRTDWTVVVARGALVIIAVLLVRWLVWPGMWRWLNDEGRIVLWGAIAFVFLWCFKRFIAFDHVRGIPIGTHSLAKMDAQQVIGALLQVDNTYASAVVPAQITYSPTHQVRGEPRIPDAIADGEVIDAPALPPPRPDQPIIEALRERGHIDRSGHSLLLGYTVAQKPAYIEMGETGLMFVAGHPGSGKTSTVSLLLAQAALMGWEIVLCDKHGRKSQGLVTRTQALHSSFSRIAIEAADIIQAIDYWHEVVSNRLSQQQTGDYRRILLVIDEFVGLMLDPTTPLPPATLHKLLSVAVEGRGVQAHGLLIAHQCSERMLGRWGANLRRAVTTRIVHRADTEDAAFLLGSAFAKQALTLPTGRALLYASGSAPEEIAIPYVVERDLQWTAERAPRLTAAQPTMPRYAPPQEPQAAPGPSPTVATVATDAVARDGMVKTLRGLRGPNGRPLFSQDAIRVELEKAGWTIAQDRLVELCQEVDRG